MTPEPIPDFETATSQFQEFLHDQALPTDILWLCREDVTSRKRRVCIRWPLPENNQVCAEEQYRRGRELGYGVCMEMLCQLGSCSCCYVWYPRDERDASQQMCRGAHFKVPVGPIRARPIRNRLIWRLVSWYDRRAEWTGLADQIPLRHGGEQCPPAS